MRVILAGFAGASRAVEPKLLPETVGVDSLNQKPGRGDLRPWRQPLQVATVPGGRQTIYRMGRDVASDSQYWLSWATRVHAERGFIATDTTERTYFTGDGAPKVLDNTDALTTPPYPTTARLLGVPAPTGNFTVTQTVAGTGTDELRFYVTTFVTDKGEESKPSAATSITCKPGATLAIAGLSAAPAGNYGITRRRVYRLTGSSDYFLIIDQASSLTTATDAGLALTATVLSSNGPSGTVGRAWDVPPADLRNLTAMWSGMFAGISGRSVRVCEAFRPHAWPVAYEILPPDVTPSALVVWDKNLLILTNGRPYVVSGSIPSALNDDPVNFQQGCVSEASAVEVGDGVCWAAPDGLAYYGSRGARLLTTGLMLREDWQAINPQTIVGTQYEGAYMGFYTVDGQVKGFIIDPSNPTGIYFLDAGYAAAYFDRLRDSLFVLSGGSIRKWDAGSAFMTSTFRSKVFRMPRPANLGWIEVTASSFPVNVTITANWVDEDGVPRTVVQTRSITSSQPTALESGFSATDWQIEVSTAGAVQGIVLASSMAELSQT
jgi:hypothetical protein